VPLHILGIILPFYSLIDMLESAINVWSDSCVAAVVQQEISQEGIVIESSPSEGALNLKRAS
jgi:Na+/H+-dicarboxylate symporter